MVLVNRTQKFIPIADTSGAKSQNAEWLSSDITYGGSSSQDILRITFAIAAQAKVEFTYNSGDNWFILEAKDQTVADEMLIRYIPMREGDAVNFRTDEVGGVTVDYFRADFVHEESGAKGSR